MKSLLLATVLAVVTTTQAAEPASTPLPVSSIEVFRIAPGQHENFLKTLQQVEAASQEVGLKPKQLFVHDSGASWDFILIQSEKQDPEKVAALFKLLKERGFPSGPDYFFESRKQFAWHEDTSALGPTTATDYLATRKKP
jgi:hypothetical protein